LFRMSRQFILSRHELRAATSTSTVKEHSLPVLLVTSCRSNY
jgi:hypothetical protein